MILSEQDKKMMAYLKRQHQAWPVTRWIIVISTLVFVGLYFLNFFDNVDTILILGFAGGLLSYSLGCWGGRPEISLLLKLLEDKDANDEK